MNTPPPQPVVAELPPDISAALENYIKCIEGDTIHRGFLGRNGWFFLVNDSNDFLRWQYGLRRWSDDQYQQALNVVASSQQWLAAKGSKFAKFVIPEKSTVYADQLPDLLQSAGLYEGRPARFLHRAPDCPVTYLFDALSDARSLGLTYFRGDSHPNWFGSYAAYLAVHRHASELLPLGNPVALRELVATATTYDGDLFGQKAPHATDALPDLARLVQPLNQFESLIRYDVNPAKRRASPGPVADEYQQWFDTRETCVWNGKDSSLPRCVIFRDSTATRLLNYLAEHFSRTVAVWWHAVIVEDVIEREEPDIVIQIQAERFLHQLPIRRPTVKVHDVLAAIAHKREMAARQSAVSAVAVSARATSR